MKNVAALDIESRKAELEREAGENGAEQSKALARMGDAIRKHGAGSKQALAFEQEADDAFERGEAIVEELLALEAQMAVSRGAWMPGRAPTQVAVAAC